MQTIHILFYIEVYSVCLREWFAFIQAISFWYIAVGIFINLFQVISKKKDCFLIFIKILWRTRKNVDFLKWDFYCCRCCWFKKAISMYSFFHLNGKLMSSCGLKFFRRPRKWKKSTTMGEKENKQKKFHQEKHKLQCRDKVFVDRVFFYVNLIRITLFDKIHEQLELDHGFLLRAKKSHRNNG